MNSFNTKIIACQDKKFSIKMHLSNKMILFNNIEMLFLFFLLTFFG